VILLITLLTLHTVHCSRTRVF